MPNWQPNWEDVRFDHGAATGAATELRATSRRIRDLCHLRGEAQRTDLHGWVGPARIEWQRRFLASQREGQALADACDREAGRIEAAAEAARTEQRARERQRESWYRERAAERAAAERAAAARAAEEARRRETQRSTTPCVPRGVLR